MAFSKVIARKSLIIALNAKFRNAKLVETVIWNREMEALGNSFPMHHFLTWQAASG